MTKKLMQNNHKETQNYEKPAQKAGIKSGADQSQNDKRDTKIMKPS